MTNPLKSRSHRNTHRKTLNVLKKILHLIKRPGLFWLSRRDVKAVRDRIIALYLAQGEYFEASAPNGAFGFDRVYFTGSVSPCFVYHIKYPFIGPTPGTVIQKEVEYRFWLKVPKSGHNPYWDYNTKVEGEGASEVKRLVFTDPKAAVVGVLVYNWARYFPFVPTDNFLQKGGAFVA